MPVKEKRIRFISFVDALHIEDADIKSFQRFCKQHNNGAMQTSNPLRHAMYLGHHFKNIQQLTGYMKCMMEYFDEPDNMLPEKFADDNDAFLDALQCVANWFVQEQNSK